VRQGDDDNENFLYANVENWYLDGFKDPLYNGHKYRNNCVNNWKLHNFSRVFRTRFKAFHVQSAKKLKTFLETNNLFIC
jgi:hypothetical protein